MPTAEQLAQINPVDGDGSSVVQNDDGSTTTTFVDGTVRVDGTDGTVMVTFPDFSVLNIAADDTRTLNDVNGSPLDPTTGAPLSGQGGDQIPTPPATTVEQLTDFVDGVQAIGDLATAQGILKGLGVAAVVDQQYGALSELATAFSDALKGEVSPVNWFAQPLKMLLAVIKAIETEERGVAMRSWCYTVVYDAMGMGAPPEPTFSGSLQGPDQDAIDKKWWEESLGKAQEQLADGQNGVALRNQVLLLIAKCNGDPRAAVTELWAASCKKSGDDTGGGLLASFPQLSWPDPTA
ncbi:hypothetical protein [Streptomyces durhamensis]|uniref:hypothetical protein n=1 Tax=Streptomyces durhamensis TaxID=68194 RepID=UPI0004CD71B3|nr:hypothetical protein [Streptomyces durhamensis]